jgi:photosystem II stability/assembly factor-like uncharacterized protein
MLRPSRYVPALASAACALLAAAICSAPATAASTVSASTVSASTVSASTAAASTATSAPTLSAAPAAAFTGIAFPVPAAGWLLGTPGSGPARTEIWHTATAGQSWQRQWQGAGNPLSITAAGQADAWALVACPGKKPSCGRELIATTDDGSRWHVIATLPAAVNQVQFYSPRLGIATSDSCLANLSLPRCPGEVLVSHDGGAHWTPVLAGAGPVFGTASASGQLWAAETFPANTAGKEPGGPEIKFVTSTNGGKSWHEVGSLAGLGLLTPELQVSLAAAPATSSGVPGLAWTSVFDPLSCAMHGCGVADLLRSGNGGRSWAMANLADGYPDDCSSDGIVFSAAPDGSAWAATGRNGAACAPPFGLMYRDGPAGWQQLPPFQLTQVSSLDAVSKDVAYAISGQDVLSRTSDGGQHWTQLRPAPAPAGQVDALSTTTALAAQDASDAGAILRSGNGGRDWTRVADLPGVVTQLNFPTASYGIAATYQAGDTAPWQLWRTWNGGWTWQYAGSLPGTNADIYGPWISAGGYGLLLTVTGGNPWEAGSGGIPPVRVWTTANWGSTWSRGSLLPLDRDTLAGPASFTSVGPSGSPGWSGWLVVATASYQQRVAVADGTDPKALSLLPSSVPAGNVQLLGHGTGFTWDLEYPGNPTVTILSLYRTTDNGRSWRHSDIRLVVPAGSSAVPLLDFSDADHGWLVLGNATWRTSNGGRTWTQG